ncbi:acyl-CoA dehydrogenase family protein [Brevundimonas vitis]|uniref:Acyl-CoA dehydrogenase family protein n=1 Tax=Brevundimonas vitisensis TaxID=2800818 RepID=A0ABX7BKU7_9CAUL|nr:acyl-CoA dehydrogenase [Brevundimonas vitisensis]QQQ17882.1 acyl-CoA dehydrogenase family protein [Brevundimonas vitisensis]
MNFDLTEDQAMLKDTAERLFAEAADGAGVWARMAEMGLLAAPFAEDDGGLGLGPVETMIVGEAMGRAQAVTPYAGAITAAGTALRLADRAPEGLIAALAGGEKRVAWACDGDLAATTTLDGWRLSGHKINVDHAAGADAFVVTALDGASPLVLIVTADAAGLTQRDYRLFDGAAASELRFEGVGPTAVLAEGETAEALIARAGEHHTAARAAEAVGLMQAVLDATLEHLKTRRQFGMTLSSFQALRHKAADMLVAQEQARSMAMFAALSVEDPDADVRRKALSQVRSVVGKAARLVAQTGVQLHGGIGVTEEHPVGRASRRLTLIDLEMERG